MNNASAHKPEDLKTLADKALPDIHDRTVMKASLILKMPELMIIQKRRQSGLEELEFQKEVIESTDEYKNAGFLLDPKHGELTKDMKEVTSERTETSKLLRDFYRHPDFIDLKNGERYGLLAAVTVGLLGLCALSLGIYSHILDSSAGAVVFTALGTFGLFVAATLPLASRTLIARSAARDLNCPDFGKALDLFVTLSKKADNLGCKASRIRDRIIYAQYQVILHERITRQIADFRTDWLNELRRTAFGIEPESQGAEIVIDEDELVEIDLHPDANIEQTTDLQYGNLAN